MQNHMLSSEGRQILTMVLGLAGILVSWGDTNQDKRRHVGITIRWNGKWSPEGVTQYSWTDFGKACLGRSCIKLSVTNETARRWRTTIQAEGSGTRPWEGLGDVGLSRAGVQFICRLGYGQQGRLWVFILWARLCSREQGAVLTSTRPGTELLLYKPLFQIKQSTRSFSYRKAQYRAAFRITPHHSWSTHKADPRPPKLKFKRIDFPSLPILLILPSLGENRKRLMKM